jgi:hypothetical protein
LVFTNSNKNSTGKMWSIKSEAMGKLEYMGEWVFIDKSEEVFKGTLEIDNDRATLTLKDCKIPELNEMRSVKFILGNTSEKITLYKCLVVKSLTENQATKIVILPSLVFIGAHFTREEDIKFKSISARFLHLDEWADISGFEDSKTNEKISISYSRPPDIQVDIGDGYKLSITFVFEVKFPGWGYYEASIKQTARIKIETDELRLWEDYKRVIGGVQKFISLGLLSRTYPFDIRGGRGNDSEIKIFDFSIKFSEPAQHIHPRLMLFTFKRIKDRFQVFIRNWFDKLEKLEFIFEDLFRSDSVEYRLLSLTQGLEQYHRNMFEEGKYLSDEEYQRVYEKLIEAIPKDISESFQEHLKKYLKYANEFSLRKRLKKIFKKYYVVLEGLGLKEKTEDIINNLVDKRNYYTHRDKEKKKTPVSWDDLAKLQIIGLTCLLYEIGFELDEIKDLFLKNLVYNPQFKG